MARQRDKNLEGYYFTDKELNERAQQAVVGGIKTAVSTSSFMPSFSPEAKQQVMALMELAKVLMTAQTPEELKEQFSTIAWDQIKQDDAADLLLGSQNKDAIKLAPLQWNTIFSNPTPEEEHYHYRSSYALTQETFLFPPYESSWVVKNCIQKFRQDIFHWSQTNNKVSDLPYESKTLMFDTLIANGKISGNTPIVSRSLEGKERPLRLIDLAIIWGDRGEYIESLLPSTTWTNKSEVEDTMMALIIALRVNQMRDEKNSAYFKVASNILKQKFDWERPYTVVIDRKEHKVPLILLAFNVLAGLHFSKNDKKFKQLAELIGDSALDFFDQCDAKKKQKYTKMFVELFDVSHEENLFWEVFTKQSEQYEWMARKISQSMMGKQEEPNTFLFDYMFSNFHEAVKNISRFDMPNITLDYVSHRNVWGRDQVKQIFQAMTEIDDRDFGRQDWKATGKHWKTLAPMFDDANRSAFEDLCAELMKKQPSIEHMRMMMEVLNQDAQGDVVRSTKPQKKM